MKDPRTDRIAREAARLLEAGQAESVAAAIRQAQGSLRLPGAPAPSAALVRRHAQAMAMQALGGTGYAEAAQGIWSTAAAIMTVLEEDLGGAAAEHVGRGAKGQFDADPHLHIRIYTESSMSEIAETLVGAGYAEPAFETVSTRLGRLNRLSFAEGGVQVTVTRLTPAMKEREGRDLFTDKPIEVLGAAQVRRRADSMESRP